jgi:hypothetical protein
MPWWGWVLICAGAIVVVGLGWFAMMALVIGRAGRRR